MSSTAGYIATDDGRLSALERILRSRTFASSGSTRQILKYVVGKSISGEIESIKEYSIATEALGRPPDFDPKSDNIVRVQMQRLRKKLEEYYEHEGAEDPLRIVIPSGHYTPEYHRLLTHKPAGAEAIAAQVDERPRPDYSRQKKGLTVWRGVALGLLVLNLVLIFTVFHVLKRASVGARSEDPLAISLAPLWQPFISATAPLPLIVYSNPVFLGNKEGDLYRYFHSTATPYSEGAEVRNLAGLERPWPLPRSVGPLYYSDVYTGVGEAVGASRIAQLLSACGRNFSIQRSDTVSIDEISRSNVVFLGSDLEDAVLRELPVEAQLAFVEPVGAGLRGGLLIRDFHPTPGRAASYESQTDKTTGALEGEYALISIFPGIKPGRHIMVLAGLSTLGTEAAAEFATSPEQMQTLDSMLAAAHHGKTRSPYFQALLHVQIRNGAVTKTDCLFVRALRER